MSVIFYSNAPTPYQEEFASVMRKYLDYRVVYASPGHKNQLWKLDASQSTILEGSPHPWRRLKRVLSKDAEMVIVGGYRIWRHASVVRYLRSRRIPYSYWMERPRPSGLLKRCLLEILYSGFLPHACFILAIGKVAAIEYSRFNKRVFSLPYSRILENFKARKPVKGKTRFLYVGQLIPRKNVVNVVAAFRALQDQSAELAIAGSGELRTIVEAAQASDSRIRYLGFVQPQDLAEIISDSDVLVFPSVYDGWALVVAEAMAAGLAIIVSDNVGAGVEYIVDGHNGVLCGRSEASIGRALQQYSSQSALVDRHGARNRAMILDSLSNADKAAQRLVSILQTWKVS